jgi:hypothetical protein
MPRKSAIVLGLMLLAASACSSGIRIPPAVGASSFAPLPIGSGSAQGDSGDASSEAGQLASQLGCSDFSADVQLDRYAQDEATCLINGDNEVPIFDFSARPTSGPGLPPGPNQQTTAAPLFSVPAGRSNHSMPAKRSSFSKRSAARFRSRGRDPVSAGLRQTLQMPGPRWPDKGLVETRGIEPLTPALQRRCSTN